MLGIIGAMDVEVAEIKESMKGVTVETIAAMDFYKGTLKGLCRIPLKISIISLKHHF